MRLFLICALLPVSVWAQPTTLPTSVPASQPTSGPTNQPASGPLVRVCGGKLYLESEICATPDDQSDLCLHYCVAPKEEAPKVDVTKPAQAEEAKLPLKKEKVARYLAAGFTVPGLVPVLGTPFLLVGPSMGHIYAKEYDRAALATLLRAASAGVAIGGGFLISEGCSFVEPCGPYISAGSAMIAGGVVSFSLLLLHSMQDASNAVFRYNTRFYDPSLREKVLPIEAAPFPEKVLRREEAGIPSVWPNRLYKAGLGIGGGGLVLGSAAMVQIWRLRSSINSAFADNAINLEEAQALSELETQRRRANAAGITADALVGVAIPLLAAGFLLERFEKKILQDAKAKETKEP